MTRDANGWPTNEEFRSAQSRPDDPEFSRRSFLKAAGFSFAGAALAGCGRAPTKLALPFSDQPEEVVAGKVTLYASTCGGCTAGCGILCRNRDGRPIKLEGNPDHPLNKGGLCAVGQAEVLSLYDSYRLKEPRIRGAETSMIEFDSEVMTRLDRIRQEGGAVRLLTGTIVSPSTKEMVGKFLAGFSNAKHVTYDPLSVAAVLDAHETTHGARVFPRYRFDKAEVIVGIDADFLGSWVSPAEYTAGYSEGRSLVGEDGRFSLHCQFESSMTVTGSKADCRFRIAPSEVRGVVAALASALAKRAGTDDQLPSGMAGVAPEIPAARRFEGGMNGIADALWRAEGKALVVCGANDQGTQIMVNFINQTLGSYKTTVDIANPSFQKEGDDRAVAVLLDELERGDVDALMIRGVNPVYDFPEGKLQLSSALAKLRGAGPAKLTLSMSTHDDETAEAVEFVCPEHHFLESWNDAEPVSGIAAVVQPAMRPLFHTRGMRESLANWMGDTTSDLDLVKDHWRRRIHPRAMTDASVTPASMTPMSFDEFWTNTVHDGHARLRASRETGLAYRPGSARAVIAGNSPTVAPWEVVLYSSIAIREGQHSGNPWLLELPDPITKVTWDNCASFSPAAARSAGIEEGDIVRVSNRSGVTLELPAHIQPGQHDRVIAIALGYGRNGSERFAAIGPRWIFSKPSTGSGGLVGVRVSELLTRDGGQGRPGLLRYSAEITLEKTGARRELALTQTHHLLSVPEGMGAVGAVVRPIVLETTLEDYRAGRTSAHNEHAVHTMWAPDHDYKGFHWGMVVNLASCTGCSACVVACQAENNIPVVGRDEVMRSREMHWLRIDRYYSGDDGDVDTVHQPMTCQHCDRAPCETVCPVLATVHSTEGLNQQVYNRCVGTRYCSNNCPYKVRRFNWFNYSHEDQLQNMQLNPDITIRSRGVMEKCSFCVQRIQFAKTEAKIRGTPLLDGEIRPACQDSCPAKAIVFGDMNDPESAVSKLLSDDRCYHVLEELGVKPSIGYLKVVRNRPAGDGGTSHV